MKYKKGTFVIVPNLDELKGKPSEMQAVYLWICSHADKDGVCFPTKSTLEKEAGCSHNTVSKYLKKLVEDGFLDIKERTTKNGRNTSNEYQLLILEGIPTKNGIYHPTNIGSQTISISNYTPLTNTIVEEVEDTNAVTLPLVKKDGTSTGKTNIDRLLYLYGKLYYHTYTAFYKPNYAKDRSILKMMLTNYSETQIAFMLCVYFDWHGMTGSDDRDYNFITGAVFPIGMFKTMSGKFEIYIRNVLGYKFDDDNEMLNKVGEYLKSIN